MEDEKIIPEKKKRAVTKNQEKLVNKYISEHYEKLNITVPKGYRDIFKQAAYGEGVSLNMFVVDAVCEKIGIDPPERNPIVKRTYNN